jgi:hypothetical protein
MLALAPVSSAVLVLLAVLAAQAPGAANTQPATKPSPMTVRVEASAKGGPAVEDWAKELRTALEARKDEFRLVMPKDKAELVVQLDSVGTAASGSPVLAGQLLLGDAKRPFTYSFTNVRTEAEKLARNLRGVADQMKATGR